MRLPLFRKSHPGGAERMLPEQIRPHDGHDRIESIIGYLVGDVKGHPHRDDLMKEINSLGPTKDLSAENREALVERIVARRDEIASRRQ